jgi:homopolymeric O-antigen transport system ATP-binding protein
MSHPAIRADNLSKRYRIGAAQHRHRTFREAITDAAAAPLRRPKGAAATPPGDQNIWALKGVSFDVEPGEVIGIIGRNGAGKSTLLKLLSRITRPTAGRAEIRGRVASLLEVGTGFHSELTGRENICLNGAILGMTRREIMRKFDEIVAFAEVEKFIDMPVKHYSSGMYLRLAFAVAAHLEPEILVVDEVLAVGDAEFQKKCLGRMEDVARAGRTVLFVSHNMPAVEGLCTRGVCLDAGSIRYIGPASDAVSDYLRASRSAVPSGSLADLPRRHGTLEAKFVRLSVRDGEGNETTQLRMGAALDIEATIECSCRIVDPAVGIMVADHRGQTVLRAFSFESSRGLSVLEGSTRVRCRFESLPLMPGQYTCNLWLSRHRYPIDYVEGAGEITIVPADVYGTGRNPDVNNGGVCFAPHSWEVHPQ